MTILRLKGKGNSKNLNLKFGSWEPIWTGVEIGADGFSQSSPLSCLRDQVALNAEIENLSQPIVCGKQASEDARAGGWVSREEFYRYVQPEAQNWLCLIPYFKLPIPCPCPGKTSISLWFSLCHWALPSMFLFRHKLFCYSCPCKYLVPFAPILLLPWSLSNPTQVYKESSATGDHSGRSRVPDWFFGLRAEDPGEEGAVNSIPGNGEWPFIWAPLVLYSWTLVSWAYRNKSTFERLIMLSGSWRTRFIEFTMLVEVSWGTKAS